MPSPIRFTCSVLGSAWERGIFAQSPGPAARLFAQVLRDLGIYLPAWSVIRLTWQVPSGKHRGQPRESHYLWQGDSTVSPHRVRPGDEQARPLPEPTGAYLWE